MLEILEYVDWDMQYDNREEVTSKILSLAGIDDPTDTERASARIMTTAISMYTYEIRRDGLKEYRLLKEGEPLGRYEEELSPLEVLDRFSGDPRKLLEVLDFHSLVDDISKGEKIWNKTERCALAVDEELQNAYEAVRSDSD